MSARQSRKARAIAYQYAKHHKIWDEWKDEKKTFRQRVLAFFFKRRENISNEAKERSRGWWYRRVLKHIARQVPEMIEDAKAFEKARKEIAKKRRYKKANALQATRSA